VYCLMLMFYCHSIDVIVVFFLFSLIFCVLLCDIHINVLANVLVSYKYG